MHQLSTGTSYLFSAALLGAVLALIAFLPSVANAQAGPPEQVTICHKPGTPDEETLTIPSPALDGHLGHGDTEGPCEGDGDTCPCAVEGDAIRVNRAFENLAGTDPVDTICVDNPTENVVSVERIANPAGTGLPNLLLIVEGGAGGSCEYVGECGPNCGFVAARSSNLTQGEFEACQADIRDLQAQSGVCP